MVGRVLLLVAAFVVAGLGALLVYLYASQADARAEARFDPVSVVVVRGPVASGTPLAAAAEQGLLVVDSVPEANVPTEALADLSDVQGFVTLTDLVEGEVLVRSRVGDPSDQRDFTLEAGEIAVSFPFTDPQRVANFVSPGSEVAVMLTYDGPPSAQASDEAAPAPAEGQVADGRSTRVILDRVRVLAAGSVTTTSTPEEGETAVSQTILTLALSKDEAERLVLADDLGDLYLALLDENSEVGPGVGADVESLFDGVSP